MLAAKLSWALSACIVLAACDLAPHPGPAGPSGGQGGAAGDGGAAVPMGGSGGAGNPCGTTSRAGELAGATSFAGNGHESVEASVMLEDGSLWLALSYDAAMAMPGLALPPPEGVDTVLVHVGADGVVMAESHRIGGVGNQHLCALARGADGAVIALGRVESGSGLVVDGDAVPGSTAGEGFLLTFGEGTLDVHQLAADEVEACGLIADETGATWVAGSYQGTLTVRDGSGPIASATGTAPQLNGFVLRLASGSPPKLNSYGPPAGEGTADDSTRVVGIVDLAPDRAVLFGDFRGTLLLGEQGLYEAQGGSDVWVVRLDAEAAYQDRGVFEGAGEVVATGIGRSPGGRTFFTGSFSGDLGFGDEPPGAEGLFVSRLKTNDLKLGGTETLISPGGMLKPTAAGPYPHGRGIVVAGEFLGDEFALLGDVMQNDDTYPDGFVVAFADDMDLLYAWHLKNPGGAQLRSVVSAPCQAVAISGSFEDGPASVRRLGELEPAETFENAEGTDGFLLQLTP
jgi:hypothetical protein